MPIFLEKMFRDRWLLRVLFVFGLALLPFLFRRPTTKDWILVYLWNAFVNGIVDKFLVSYRLLTYPHRLLANIFDINVLFDYLWYPIITVVYNRWTERDGPVFNIMKLLALSIPVTGFEIWAEKWTGLVKYKKWWRWYHSFSGMLLKSLLTRRWISFIRKVDGAKSE